MSKPSTSKNFKSRGGGNVSADSDLNWSKYILKDETSRVKVDGSDFIKFFIAQLQMFIHITTHQAESILLENEAFNIEILPEPERDPRYAAIKEVNADLAYKMEREFRKEYNEWVRTTASIKSMKAMHDAKVVIINRAFSDYLGPTVMGIVANELKNKQYFEAWHKLHEHFCKNSMKKRLKVARLLSTMTYDKSVCSMSAFIQLIRTLGRIYGILSNGEEIEEEQMLLYLSAAVRNGNGNFNFELNLIDLGNISFDDADAMLVERADTAGNSRRSKPTQDDSEQQQTGGKRGGNNNKESNKFQAHNATNNNTKNGGGKQQSNNSTPSRPADSVCHKCNGTGHWACDPICPKFAERAAKRDNAKKQSHNTVKEPTAAEIHESYLKKFEEMAKDMKSQLQAHHAHAAFNRSLQFVDNEFDPEAHMVTVQWRKLSKDPKYQQPVASDVDSSPVTPAKKLNFTSNSYASTPLTIKKPSHNVLPSMASPLSNAITSTPMVKPSSSTSVVLSEPSSYIVSSELESLIAAEMQRIAESKSKSVSKLAVSLQPITEDTEHTDNNDVNSVVVGDEEKDDAEFEESINALAAVQGHVIAKPTAIPTLPAKNSASVVGLPVLLGKTRLASTKLNNNTVANMVTRQALSQAKIPSKAIFDTGATDHMTDSIANLDSSQPLGINESGGQVLLGGNKKYALPIVAKGVDGILSNVLVVPGLKTNLISGPTLMKDGYLQMYLHNRVFVYDLKSLTLVSSGTLGENNLVYRDLSVAGPTFEQLISQCREGAVHKEAVSKEAIALSNGSFSSAVITDQQFIHGKAQNRPIASRAHVKNELRILHNRTLHAGAHKLLNMVNNRTAIGACVTAKDLKNLSLGTCTACYLGKFNKFPAPESFSIKPSSNMHVIRSDIEGPFRTCSVHGNLYWQLSEDPCSETLWINFMSVKAKANSFLMDMQSTIADPLGLKIRVFQSDSDTIYKDRKLLQFAVEQGCKLQYTAPYRHEGSIEARQKVVLEMTRSVLADGDIPEKYWEPVAEAVVYVLNRLPTARHPDSCPIKELTGKIPDISHLVPLGYPAIAKVYDEEHRTTLEPKGITGMVIGYDEPTGAYKFVTKTGKLLIRKDVVVDENTGKKRLKNKLFRAYNWA